jgi:hypothetical protein
MFGTYVIEKYETHVLCQTRFLHGSYSFEGTAYPRFNSLIGEEGCPILSNGPLNPNVRIPHKHVRRMLPSLIFRSILLFYAQVFLFLFVHDVFK